MSYTTSISAVERVSCRPDLYATSISAVEQVSCGPDLQAMLLAAQLFLQHCCSKMEVDQAWMGPGKAFHCIISVNYRKDLVTQVSI